MKLASVISSGCFGQIIVLNEEWERVGKEDSGGVEDAL